MGVEEQKGKAVELRDLLEYEDIMIQCHDNPDADALASGYAVYLYLVANGKKPSLIYGGNNIIRKANLLMVIEDLQIPIEHVDTVNRPELLVMVDCQYKGGNSAVFPAENIAVIDHHRVNTELPRLAEVRSNLGACSTLVWKMLKDVGYDVEHDKKLSTALYYGLYTDTSGFAEIAHPLDRDLRDEAKFDSVLIRKYRNANMTLEDLEVAGAALLHNDYMEEYRAAIVKVAPCDSNILGIISDLVLEVDAIDVCIVFNEQPNGVKISVRSCIKEVKANELAAELCKGIGAGGGHVTKAGGLIQMELLTTEYLQLCETNHFKPRMELDANGKREQPAASGIKAVLSDRFSEYMENTDILYADEYELNEENAEHYCSRPVPWGYVRATEFYPEGTEISVRTLQGDFDRTLRTEDVMTIGPKGEIYFVDRDKFERQYRVYEEWQYTLHDAEYEPTIRNKRTGEIISPMSKVRVCVPNGIKTVLAQKLSRKVKLFRKEDPEQQYTLGRVGDYLLQDPDGKSGIRVMREERFQKLYRKKDEKEKSVIFDLDGTLLDTLEDLKNAVNAALEATDMPTCTLEQVRQYVGNGVRKLMLRAVKDGENNPRFEEAFAYFKEYYKEHCLDNTRLYPQVEYLLRELQTRGVKMAIVSNKFDPAVKELNERFFGKYMAAAIGEMEGVARKPEPDMVYKALREMGADSKEAVYVGDSEVDIATARNAGLPCFSVTWGFREVPFLRSHGAKFLIHTPLELLYLI